MIRKKWQPLALAGTAAFLLAACGGEEAAEETAEAPVEEAETADESQPENEAEPAQEEAAAVPADESVAFDHSHGLGFTGDGTALVMPAHDGIRHYTDGVWTKGEGEAHDFMGFAMTKDGFYSSGHPAPGSELPEPLGLVKSDNAGTDVNLLALEGEVDFHGMAAGYNSGVIYVLNPHPNSMIENPGLHMTKDEGKTWTAAEANGLTGNITSIAVHPDDENVVAMGSEAGVLLSTDGGNTFEPVLEDKHVTSVAFNFNNDLLAGSAGSENMTVVPVDGGEPASLLDIPLAEEELIGFMAVNPADEAVIAVTTTDNNVFISRDGGEQWKQIAKEGTALNEGE